MVGSTHAKQCPAFAETSALSTSFKKIKRSKKLKLRNVIHNGFGHTIELNRDLASKSRLTSNHDLAENRDLIYF